MWDASADGYTRGEGFASVILKTLSQALADGDHIEAIVRETGVNSDGRTPGVTCHPSKKTKKKTLCMLTTGHRYHNAKRRGTDKAYPRHICQVRTRRHKSP